jgi:hypothetical protein
MSMVRGKACAGFTLVEALAASAVLGLAVIALTQAVTAGQAQTHEAMRSSQAVNLAEAMAEEILSLPYHDPDGASAPGPEGGESPRLLLDNMDDYHGLGEPLGQVRDIAGVPYGGNYARFSRSVSCVYTTMTVPGLTSVGNGLSVRVTVRDERGRVWAVTRFIPEPSP